MIKTRTFNPANIPRAATSSARRADKLAEFDLAPRILGVDPGLLRTGYGVIQSDGSRLKLIEGGVLRAKPADPFPKRLQELHDGLAEVIRDNKPDLLVIEDLFSTYAHPRSALLMAHARGVLMLAGQEAGLPVHSFTPNEIKQVVTGNGHATKSNVQAAVKARLRLTIDLHPPDVADALAIAICFALRQATSDKLGN
ncbi:crossover junction endodeoxyribonuclease RuvC [bacterium]|nr:MAG: crossover junction endodeoxyribonuclease RuvC [bacterium]